MTDEDDRPSKTGIGALFIREFHDRDLVDFEQCSKHYADLSPDLLCQEMAYLMQPDIRAIPFGFSGYRHYALAQAMVDCAANWREMTDIYRGKMINLCIDLLEYNCQRTAPASRDALLKAVLATLDSARTFGLFPGVADVIATGKRDHFSPFEEGVVGQVLERER